jgi:hypothetical protein
MWVLPVWTCIVHIMLGGLQELRIVACSNGFGAEHSAQPEDAAA